MAQSTGQEIFLDAIRPRISAHDIMGSQRKILQNQGVPIFGNGYLGNFAGGVGSSFLRGIGDVATFVGADSVADIFDSGSNYLEERLKPAKPAEFSLDYILSPEGLARGSGNLGGSILSIALPSLLAPESLPANIGRGISGAAKLFGRAMSPKTATMMGRGAMTGIPEAAMEGGNWYKQQVAAGMNPDEAWDKRWGVFGRNAVFLPISNAVQWGLFSKMLNGRPILAGLGEHTSQVIEEGMQQGFQNEVVGKPYTYNPYEMATNPLYAEQAQDMKAAFLDMLPFTALGIGGGMIRDRYETNRRKEEASRHSEEFASNYQTTKENYRESYGELRSWADKISDGQMSDEVFNTIISEARRNGIPVQIALAQATAESNGRQDDVSDAGAIGVMQLMPETAAGLGVDPHDMEQNVAGGMKYLKQMYDKYGNWNLAFAAYNAGSGAVDKYGGIPPYSETQNYVAEINDYLNKSPDAENEESQEEIYRGENGAGEGKTWFRQGNVSLEGAQPNLLNAIDILADWLYKKTGRRLVVTAGTNGDHPSNGSEHGHDAGWKVDVVDEYNDGEDSDLITADFQKGKLADEFIAYGRSLGLGMNFEDAGSHNFHFDIALDGTQWDGNGENAGGFNPKKARPAPPTNVTSTTSAPDAPDNENPFNAIIANLLNDDEEFDSTGDDEFTKSILESFATGKRETADGRELVQLDSMFGNKGFQNNAKTRKTLNDLYGEELREFGQEKFSERLTQVAGKIQAQTELDAEDRKFLGGVLKSKLKSSGVKVGGEFSDKLISGDLEALKKGQRALADAPKPPAPSKELSDIISGWETEIRALSDQSAQASTPEEFAAISKQITNLGGQITTLKKLGTEISGLQMQLQKASQTLLRANVAGDAKLIASATEKVSNLNAQIDSKNAALQKIIAPQVEDATPKTAPVSGQTATYIAQLDSQIAALNQQFTPENLSVAGQLKNLNETRDKVLKVNQNIFDLTNATADLWRERETAQQSGDNTKGDLHCATGQSNRGFESAIYSGKFIGGGTAEKSKRDARQSTQGKSKYF